MKRPTPAQGMHPRTIVDSRPIDAAGESIRVKRVKLHLSYDSLARLMLHAGSPISGPTIRNWELGRSTPRVDQYRTICTILKIRCRL